MEIIQTPLSGVLLIKPKVFGDNRGFFFESFRASSYLESFNLPTTFVQDNISRSQKDVLRGLHYQLKQPQDKLVTVIRGCVYDAVVDIRRGSPTFGQSWGVYLSDKDHFQLFIPKGFAHGFCVVSDEVDFHYKCTDYYHPASERGIFWADPVLKIEWPVQSPNVSAKDALYPHLKDILPEDLPR